MSVAVRTRSDLQPGLIAVDEVEVSEKEGHMIMMSNQVSGDFAEQPVFLERREIWLHMHVDEAGFPQTNANRSPNASAFINSLRCNGNIRKIVIVDIVIV
jgi:hypothetical protein